MDFPEVDHEKMWKYANAEIERKFLLTEKPDRLYNCPQKEIEDKYLNHTRLRLRKTTQGNHIQYKLSKKLPINLAGEMIQWISTIYLSEEEYDIFSSIEGKSIKKKRYYFAPNSGNEIGIDEIELGTRKVWIAEVEFKKGENLNYTFPLKYEREVTHEKEYFGSELAKYYVEK